MKTPSFAIMVLLGMITVEQASAISLKQMHRESSDQQELPPDEILLELEETRRHKKWPLEHMYKENTKKRKWWELDNHHERLHGTHPNDDLSPYDPDVVDAPEDIKRVGNDHEPLHNAKLSPKGYYTGFFHKDY